MKEALWYALMFGDDDTDWGDGTYDKQYALERLAEIQEVHPEAFIAVITEVFDERGNVVSGECIDEIREVY